MKTTLAFAVLAWTASTVFAQGDAHVATEPVFNAAKVEERTFGREGDPKKVTRTIKLDMTDAFRFTPADVAVERGATVKFVVANSGRLLHEMVLGTTEELKAHSPVSFPATTRRAWSERWS